LKGVTSAFIAGDAVTFGDAPNEHSIRAVKAWVLSASGNTQPITLTAGLGYRTIPVMGFQPGELRRATLAFVRRHKVAKTSATV